MKIEIYTNGTCGYCQQVKEELDKNNIEYKNKNTKEHAKEFQNITNLVDMGTVPIIVVNDTNFLCPVRDFNSPQHLVVLLNNFEDNTFSDNKMCLEKIKTLNHHIGTAFGNLDRILQQIETKINKDEHESTN